MSAAAVILLILFLIAVGMTLYYAVLCYQAKPFDGKGSVHPDLGPLLANEHDLNGNHDLEEVVHSAPPMEQPDSAPGPSKEDADRKEENLMHLDPPLKSVKFQATPECAAVCSPGDSVILPIEDEPSFSNSSKSIVPVSLMNLGHPSPNGLHPILKESKEPHQTILIPNSNASDEPLQAMSVSYEEDGLLVPRNTVGAVYPQSHPHSILHNSEEMVAIPIEDSKHNDEINTTQPGTYRTAPPKHVHFQPPLVGTPSVDTSNLPYSKAQQQIKNKVNTPVFHFSTPNSSCGDEDKPLTAFSPKHKGEENCRFPSKKAKMSPVEDLRPKFIIPNGAFSPTIYRDEGKDHQTEKEELEINVSVPGVNISEKTMKEESVIPGETSQDDERDVGCSDVPKVISIEYAKEADALTRGEGPESITADEEIVVTSTKGDGILTDKLEEQEKVMTIDNNIPFKLVTTPVNDNIGKSSGNGEEEKTANSMEIYPNQPKPSTSSPIGWNVGESNENATSMKQLGERDKIDANSLSIPVRIHLPSEGSESYSPEGSRKESESETSEPEVTEYSFQGDPEEPSTATVLADEVSCYAQDKIDLTQYAPILEETSADSITKLITAQDSTTPIKGDSSPPLSPSNLLGTPPNTPPNMKHQPTPLIISNPCAECPQESPSDVMDSLPPFIVIDPHVGRQRNGSTSSSSSESSSTGSYTFESISVENHQQVPSDKRTKKASHIMH